MQDRIGTYVFDAQRRPVVIARLATPFADVPAAVTAAKDAVGRGADTVEIAADSLDRNLLSALADVGVTVVARATHGDDAACVIADGVRALHWAGPGPLPELDPTQRGEVTVLSGTPDGLVSGDHLVLDPGAACAPSRPPRTFRHLVAIPEAADRAGAAALVTIALEAGASGFVTSSPAPVRRAAYVIRAVELAS